MERGSHCVRGGAPAPSSPGSPAKRDTSAWAQEALERLGVRHRQPGVLTPREREVLRVVAEGLSDPEIATRLVVSEHTVHRHVANIRGKLRQPSRAAAVAHAARNGLL